ncbi:hypothetical protein FB451DRAFT_1175856 [Mycena latifolia]|nr:hypothetical protein FB451DRAFT_1175856 [Mycena latifolia]
MRTSCAVLHIYPRHQGVGGTPSTANPSARRTHLLQSAFSDSTCWCGLLGQNEDAIVAVAVLSPRRTCTFSSGVSVSDTSHVKKRSHSDTFYVSTSPLAGGEVLAQLLENHRIPGRGLFTRAPGVAKKLGAEQERETDRNHSHKCFLQKPIEASRHSLRVVAVFVGVELEDMDVVFRGGRETISIFEFKKILPCAIITSLLPMSRCPVWRPCWEMAVGANFYDHALAARTVTTTSARLWIHHALVGHLNHSPCYSGDPTSSPRAHTTPSHIPTYWCPLLRRRGVDVARFLVRRLQTVYSASTDPAHSQGATQPRQACRLIERDANQGPQVAGDPPRRTVKGCCTPITSSRYIRSEPLPLKSLDVGGADDTLGSRSWASKLAQHGKSSFTSAINVKVDPSVSALCGVHNTLVNPISRKLRDEGIGQEAVTARRVGGALARCPVQAFRALMPLQLFALQALIQREQGGDSWIIMVSSARSRAGTATATTRSGHRWHATRQYQRLTCIVCKCGSSRLRRDLGSRTHFGPWSSCSMQKRRPTTGVKDVQAGLGGPAVIATRTFLLQCARRVGAPSNSDAMNDSSMAVGEGRLNFTASIYLESLYAPEEYEKAIAVKSKRKPLADETTGAGSIASAAPENFIAEHPHNELDPPASGDIQPFNLSTHPSSLLHPVDPSSSTSRPISIPGEAGLASSFSSDSSHVLVTAALAPFPVAAKVSGNIHAASDQYSSPVCEEKLEKEDTEEQDAESSADLVPAAYTCSNCGSQTNSTDSTDASRPSNSHLSKRLGGALVCGECSLYERLYGEVRSEAPNSSSAERPKMPVRAHTRTNGQGHCQTLGSGENPTAALKSPPAEVEQCSNCGNKKGRTRRKRGWYFSKYGKTGKELICDTCYHYEWRNHRPRSQQAVARAQARSKK